MCGVFLFVCVYVLGEGGLNRSTTKKSSIQLWKNKNQVLELPLFTCMYQNIIEDHVRFNVQMVVWLTVHVPKGASIGINKYVLSNHSLSRVEKPAMAILLDVQLQDT